MQENPDSIEKKDVEADTSEAVPEPEEGAQKKAEKELEVEAEVETAKEAEEVTEEEIIEVEAEEVAEEEIIAIEAEEVAEEEIIEVEAEEVAEEEEEEEEEEEATEEEAAEEEAAEEERSAYTMKRRLTKSKSNKIIFGVCGGIGEYFGIDPTLIRLAFVLFAFLNGIGIAIYIILAVIMPSESGIEMSKE